MSLVQQTDYIHRQAIQVSRDIIKTILPEELYCKIECKIEKFFTDNIKKDTLINRAAAWKIIDSFISFFDINRFSKEDLAKVFGDEPYTRKKIHYQQVKSFIELKNFWAELGIDERIFLGFMSMIEDGKLTYAELLQDKLYSQALNLGRDYTRRLIEDILMPGILEPPREKIQRAPEVDTGIFPSQTPVQTMAEPPRKLIIKKQESSKEEKTNWLGWGLLVIAVGVISGAIGKKI